MPEPRLQGVSVVSDLYQADMTEGMTFSEDSLYVQTTDDDTRSGTTAVRQHRVSQSQPNVNDVNMFGAVVTVLAGLGFICVLIIVIAMLLGKLNRCTRSTSKRNAAEGTDSLLPDQSPSPAANRSISYRPANTHFAITVHEDTTTADTNHIYSEIDDLSSRSTLQNMSGSYCYVYAEQNTSIVNQSPDASEQEHLLINSRRQSVVSEQSHVNIGQLPEVTPNAQPAMNDDMSGSSSAVQEQNYQSNTVAESVDDHQASSEHTADAATTCDLSSKKKEPCENSTANSNDSDDVMSTSGFVSGECDEQFSVDANCDKCREKTPPQTRQNSLTVVRMAGRIILRIDQI